MSLKLSSTTSMKYSGSVASVKGSLRRLLIPSKIISLNYIFTSEEEKRLYLVEHIFPRHLSIYYSRLSYKKINKRVRNTVMAVSKLPYLNVVNVFRMSSRINSRSANKYSNLSGNLKNQ